MSQFNSPVDSHQHSLEVLKLLHEYDSFLDSIEVVADMGCGRGLDALWWATLKTRDDPPEPRNYLTYAIDKNLSQLAPELAGLKNVKPIEGNFEKKLLPRKVDLMWCHNAFQYVTNPLGTLQVWNQQMNVNGMLIIVLEQTIGHRYNRLSNRTENYCYHNYSLANLVYQLAVSGFDCRDAYAKKDENNPWIYFACYKNDENFLDPSTTSWHDLIDKNLVHPSIAESVTRNGYVKQEEIFYPWFDKDFHFIRD